MRRDVTVDLRINISIQHQLVVTKTNGVWVVCYSLYTFIVCVCVPVEAHWIDCFSWKIFKWSHSVIPQQLGFELFIELVCLWAVQEIVLGAGWNLCRLVYLYTGPKTAFEIIYVAWLQLQHVIGHTLHSITLWCRLYIGIYKMK